MKDEVKKADKEEQKEEIKEDAPPQDPSNDLLCLNDKCKQKDFATTKMGRILKNMLGQLQF